MLFEHDLGGSIETTPLMPPQQPYALLPADHRFAQQAKVSLADLVLEPMILLDVLPSRTYFVSIFEERGLTPNIVFSSPSIEMVRGMVGRGFGFSILVTKPFTEYTYDGQKLVCIPLAETVTGSGLSAVWLRRAPLTKPVQLFVDYCREEVGWRRTMKARALPVSGTAPGARERAAAKGKARWAGLGRGAQQESGPCPTG